MKKAAAADAASRPPLAELAAAEKDYQAYVDLSQQFSSLFRNLRQYDMLMSAADQTSDDPFAKLEGRLKKASVKNVRIPDPRDAAPQPQQGPTENKPPADKPATENKPAADKPATENKPAAGKGGGQANVAQEQGGANRRPRRSRGLLTPRVQPRPRWQNPTLRRSCN